MSNSTETPTRGPRLSRELDPGRLNVSFEFFPPKTEKMAEGLWRAVEQLAPLQPDFVSVTYGAGGSTRERTHATVKKLIDETELRPAAHLTCVDATREEVNDVVDAYYDAGVRDIVALRGDPSAGVGTRFTPADNGYVNAADLVAALARRGGFEISVGAYPEKHPESASVTADLDNLKAKIDAGATRAITQFFFDNAHYLRFLDACEKHGIDVPIIPGILPIYSFKQVSKFAKDCGTELPEWVAKRFEGVDDEPEARQLVAAAFAAEQVTDLIDHGVTDFHFYTLNKAPLVYAICRMLGMSANGDTPKGTSVSAACVAAA